MSMRLKYRFSRPMHPVASDMPAKRSPPSPHFLTAAAKNQQIGELCKGKIPGYGFLYDDNDDDFDQSLGMNWDCICEG